MNIDDSAAVDESIAFNHFDADDHQYHHMRQTQIQPQPQPQPQATRASKTYAQVPFPTSSGSSKAAADALSKPAQANDRRNMPYQSKHNSNKVVIGVQSGTVDRDSSILVRRADAISQYEMKLSSVNDQLQSHESARRNAEAQLSNSEAYIEKLIDNNLQLNTCLLMTIEWLSVLLLQYDSALEDNSLLHTLYMQKFESLKLITASNTGKEVDDNDDAKEALKQDSHSQPGTCDEYFSTIMSENEAVISSLVSSHQELLNVVVLQALQQEHGKLQPSAAADDDLSSHDIEMKSDEDNHLNSQKKLISSENKVLLSSLLSLLLLTNPSTTVVNRDLTLLILLIRSSLWERLCIFYRKA
jgi:hypothetical protein